jgi:hypothetical protein
MLSHRSSFKIGVTIVHGPRYLPAILCVNRLALVALFSALAPRASGSNEPGVFTMENHHF